MPTPSMMQILKAWSARLFQYGCERPGQALFNTVLELAPEVAEELRGQPFDPYYDDRQIGEALALVQRRARARSPSRPTTCATTGRSATSTQPAGPSSSSTSTRTSGSRS